MNLNWPSWQTWRSTSLTIALGAIGGLVFTVVGLPAAWMSGAMVAVAAAALGRLPVSLPDPLRDALFVVLGLSMGAGVTPEVVDRVSDWPWTMAALVVVVALVTAATFVFLRYAARWDPEAAYFGAIPGALSFVMALAAERKVDLARIAASQSTRLLILIVVLPLFITSTANHPPHGLEPEILPTLLQMAVLFALCVGASLVAVRVGVPGGWLTGAFFMSSALNASGAIPVALPEFVLVPCYIGLGCFIGSRFSSTSLTVFLRIIKASMGAVAVGLCVSTVIALVVSSVLDLPFGQLLLAYAPGGLEVMTLLAFMMDLDPAFVAAHQLVRYIGMVLLLPFATRLFLGPG
ncbi:AbrB family transcriptional regulator [Labrenzia sp. CE80]|uniref:AbrB family transcriptional regulator n=1 Tax=Labrenzia sp. CE80 TaxID=1788986 RepID=UPI001AD8AD05|nr:AbrB family transcriptional regulator [Labrenzia sp. CE80]